MEEDNKLYELLNVSRTASEAEIKKVSFKKGTCAGIVKLKDDHLIGTILNFSELS